MVYTTAVIVSEATTDKFGELGRVELFPVDWQALDIDKGRVIPQKRFISRT
jgi:hypothetical protein